MGDMERERRQYLCSVFCGETPISGEAPAADSAVSSDGGCTCTCAGGRGSPCTCGIGARVQVTVCVTATAAAGGAVHGVAGWPAPAAAVCRGGWPSAAAPGAATVTRNLPVVSATDTGSAGFAG